MAAARPSQTLSSEDTARRDALAGRVFGAAVQTADLFAIYLGARLGFYEALSRDGPLNSSQLSRAAKASERYAREWLEQQAVSGFLDVVSASQDGRKRTYALNPGHAEVLLNEQSESYLAFFPRYFVATGGVMPKLLRAYQTGRGLSWGAYGEDLWRAQSEQNRPFLTHQFVQKYIARVPEIHKRLQSEPGARVVDVACGAGWSSLALAKAYPKIRVDGYDLDRAALALARKNAKAAGLEDRVSFFARDAADPRAKGRYDVATIVEAVHDLSYPVKVLSSIRNMLAPSGMVLVVDENTTDEFRVPGTDVDRMLYGFSLIACLANGLDARKAAGTGTVMRPSTMHTYAKKAGFASTQNLELAHDFFRFYLLRR
jgi:2-polyprenyl-3-methyl-5-hydroxy-6-metoxy-1,4-benzoquinol methylase